MANTVVSNLFFSFKVDLMTGGQVSQIQHDYKIDWLELNETAKYILFRDKKMKVNV